MPDIYFDDAERELYRKMGAIAAMRHFRERTGLGLIEAKRAMEAVKHEALKCDTCDGRAAYKIIISDIDGNVLDSSYLCAECYGGSDLPTFTSVPPIR